MMKRDFIALKDFSRQELQQCLHRAIELKQLVKKSQVPQILSGKSIALIFEKASTRTHVSFEVAIHLLGGHSIYLNQQSSQLGRGETYADTARVLSRYVNAIMVRTFSHEALVELARFATVPIINGLTDSLHPCQLMADLMTLQEKRGDVSQLIISYVGDGNNMAQSWMEAAAIFGFELRVATPPGYEVDEKLKKDLSCPHISFGHDANAAVQNAHVINTDTWFSMGQEVTQEKRQAFWPFQVNNELLKQARPDVLVLHCLPAHRQEEITNEVMDGPHSVVFDQAENRLYAQMAILEKLFS